MKYKCSGCGEEICAYFNGDNVNDHVHCGKCGKAVTWRDAISGKVESGRPWGLLLLSCGGTGLFGYMMYAVAKNGGEVEFGGIIMLTCALTFIWFLTTGVFSILGLSGWFDPDPNYDYAAEERNRKIVEKTGAMESEAMYKAYLEKIK